MRYRTTYNSQAVFVGPAPHSGYHFLSESGFLVNDPTQPQLNYNLLFQLDRVKSLSYSIEPERISIKEIGTKSIVAQPIINHPQVNLEINYCLNGVKNEARLGFTVNHARLEYPFSGQPYYAERISPISGFTNRLLTPNNITGDPYVPYYNYRDSRNVFLAFAPDGSDVYSSDVRENFVNISPAPSYDPYAHQKSVLCFGNCFVSNYGVQCQVGGVPEATVNLVAENMLFHSSGSGVHIPAVETKSGTLFTGVYFSIPPLIKEGGPSILNPGDIVLDINSHASTLNNTIINLKECWIDSFDFDINLNREPLNSLGYKLPIDKRITFPVFVNLNFNMLVGERQTGDLSQLLKLDDEYDITIKLRNPQCFGYTTGENNPRQSGPALGVMDTAIRYDFIKAKFISFNANSSVSQAEQGNFSFVCELDPDTSSYGFFISGLLNIEKLDDYWLHESSGSDDDAIITDDFGIPHVTARRPILS